MTGRDASIAPGLSSQLVSLPFKKEEPPINQKLLVLSVRLLRTEVLALSLINLKY